VYILYRGDFTRSTLVQWVLEEGKIEYEFRRIDIVKSEHRSAEFLAINPAGLVPALRGREARGAARGVRAAGGGESGECKG